jgi:hypothetical protein
MRVLQMMVSKIHAGVGSIGRMGDIIDRKGERKKRGVHDRTDN